MKRKKGLFISFEGGEAAGKSTQIKKLAQALSRKGYSTLVTREPGGTKIGEKLRQIHKKEDIQPLTELFLIEASRVEHLHQKIKPALDKGKIVISDRFCESTLIYQGFLRGLDLKLIRQLNEVAMSKTKPDLVIWMDLNLSKTLERLGLRREETTRSRDRFDDAQSNTHRKIISGYRKLSKTSRNPPLQRIDASQSMDVIHEEILALVQPHLQTKGRTKGQPKGQPKGRKRKHV